MRFLHSGGIGNRQFGWPASRTFGTACGKHNAAGGRTDRGHEFCHLRHSNQDRSFFRLVGTILPDRKARRAWLDQNEHFLTLRRVEPT
ncbi:M48 family metallopeptidase [Skermanella rosea]|uniref:YgjP-like metallopeptidase domain-containing protein n=1 Tax=Skermanella rosea TaxID=1817965 RepID=UPI00193416C9|nr:M48 family metallopeptidase [Skermanella rosea]